MTFFWVRSGVRWSRKVLVLSRQPIAGDTMTTAEAPTADEREIPFISTALLTRCQLTLQSIVLQSVSYYSMKQWSSFCVTYCLFLCIYITAHILTYTCWASGKLDDSVWLRWGTSKQSFSSFDAHNYDPVPRVFRMCVCVCVCVAFGDCQGSDSPLSSRLRIMVYFSIAPEKPHCSLTWPPAEALSILNYRHKI